MEQYKSLNKLKNRHHEKKEPKLKVTIRSLILKSMICIIICLISLITIKTKPILKSTIYRHVYEDSISFAKINNLYQKYFGSVLPFENIVPDTELVFKEHLKYGNVSLYKDGAKLSVTDNYLIPVLESGIVVFIGEKENYGNTIIVQQINGIDTWYGNVNTSDIKLYDYVEKGNLLSEANGNYMYLVFQKEGKFLDYKKYI